MKKKMIALLLSLVLLSSCGATKPASDRCCEAETKTETISGENDPIMKLLLSGLIILSVNFLFTK